jgi:hypothetical protein
MQIGIMALVFVRVHSLLYFFQNLGVYSKVNLMRIVSAIAKVFGAIHLAKDKAMAPPTIPIDDIFSTKLQRNWTPELVERRFEEMFLTLARLPPAVTLGYHNLWPDIKYSRIELLMQKPGTLPHRLKPEEISKMEEALQWIIWVDIPERKLIWKRAAGVPWKAIMSETRLSRTTLWTQYKLALSQIAERLEGMGKAPR